MLFFQLPSIAEKILERNDWQMIEYFWKEWSPKWNFDDDLIENVKTTFTVFDFPEAGEVINNTNIVTETPRNVENVLEASNFEYKLIGYRIGETDSSVIVKKGNKEFVVFVGEDLEGLYTLIDVNQKEIVFRNEDKLYKITNVFSNYY